MPKRYYLDTCIWMDYFENRMDKFRPLGEWALMLINKIIEEGDNIIYSDIVEEELKGVYSAETILSIIRIVPSDLVIEVESSLNQLKEAMRLSKELRIPKNDALHAILARDNDVVLITRDKHFYELAEEVEIRKPEDLI